jgi:hypothetical protein
MNHASPALTILALAMVCGVAEGQATAQGLPDIVGLKPGMTLQEAYDRLKAHNRIAKVEVGRMLYPDLGPEPIPYAIVLGQEGELSADLIEADVTLPPGKPVVWRVVRTLRFPQGQEQPITNLMAALREKYGPESFVVKSNIPTPNWFFDGQGKVVADTGGLSFSSCAMGGIPSINAGILNGGVAPLQINLIQPLRQTGTNMDLCRALVTVRAVIQPGPDPGLAMVMSVSIADGPLETRAREATVEFLAHAAAARKQALESAAPPPKPKL